MSRARQSDLPPPERVVGPGFHERVYAVVRRVPRGRVTTYGDVATILGSPRVARHVGWALAALREPGVPWHRVINYRGGISFRGEVGRASLQRRLLEKEGVRFDEDGLVDLERLRWRFGLRPGAAQPRARRAGRRPGCG
jgi:methylated-DNA-protein-cysteine methyltransferase-like protein